MSAQPLRIYSGDVTPPSQTVPTLIPIPGTTPPRRKKKNPTLRAVFEKRVKPALLAKGRKGATIQSIDSSVAKWEEYWQKHTWILDTCVLRVRGIKLKHMEAFQRWLATTAVSERGKPYSACSVNRIMGAIRQVLRAAERKGLLTNRPQVERLATRAAKKWYFRREQFDSLMDACDGCTWPRDLPTLDTPTWWRALLSMYWLYGFRTQELYAFQSDKTPLHWSAITLGTETPNPEGQAESEYGWLTYVPEKQSWAKPEPLYIPLTRHARAIIDLLAKATRELHGGELPPGAKLFPWSTAHRSFYAQWESLQQRARVQTKAGGAFEIKHFRKTAATYLEEHHKGLAAAVIGWADRNESQVMANHYVVSENVLVSKLHTYPVPKSFSRWLDPSGPQLRLF